MTTQAYDLLTQRAQEIAYLKSANSLMNWDQETYMPPKALEYRARQLAYFQGKIHELLVADEVGDWIKAAEDKGYPEGSDEAVNVREWRYEYDRSSKVPKAFEEEFAEKRSLATAAWQKAKGESDFAQFKPHLENIIDLNRRRADYYGWEDCRYDALLEDYERGARAKQLKVVFDELQPKVSALAQEAAEGNRKKLPDGPYPIEVQKQFNREVCEAIGFDLEAGRIDTAAHPFCAGIHPGDTRMTNRYDDVFTNSLSSVMHEAGHGLYDQGLPSEHYGLPLGHDVSLGIHESQSRMWENHVGRSLAFWETWFPRAAELFPQLASLTPLDVYHAVNRAELSYIRVDADEVTYDLHIILRFEIESQLIAGEIEAADVPAAWNEKFEKLFGLKVPNDAKGCLQDIHWSLGAMGYFPTYSLGNLNASQLYKKALDSNPEFVGQIKAGDYSGLLGWLRTNIHQQGKRYLPPALMKRVTGEDTKADYHLEHLRERYIG